MSGLMNLFKKNTKLENTQQMALPKKYSSSEDIYEAVDRVDESAPSSGDYEWSDNEFEDEEDIYTNDSELLQKTPVLPPRSRGQPQVEQSTPSLPPRTMTSNPLTSKTASSTPGKPTLSQQDSNDSAEPYEEFSEKSHDNKFYDSGDEDYEQFDSTLVSSRSSPLLTPLSAQPTPSLPSRSNRPCPPPPTDHGQPSEDTYVDNDTTAKQDGGIFSKMVSAFKQKHIFHLPINLSVRPTNIKQAEISDDFDTYKVEDTPLKPTKYLSPQHPKPLPKSPDTDCDQDDFLEAYEITDVSPTLPTGPKPIVNDPKIPGSSLEAKKLPALSAAKDLPADQMTEPKWNKLKIPDPDSEEDSRNSELKVKSSPAPSTRNIPMKPRIRANIQDESSKMIKEKSSESEPTVKKNRLIPYTPVIPKIKDVNDSDGKPKCSFLMKNLPPNKIISPSEFNEIKTGDSDITSSGNSKSNITQIKSNYLKPIPPKIQIKKSSESGESNSLEISNNPSKNYNPGHIPPKLRAPRPGIIDSDKNKDKTLTSSDFPILLDAKNKLRSLVNTLNTEQDDNKKKTSELTYKSSSHQTIAPVVHMPQNKLPPVVPESKVQKDYQEKKTFATDEKVAKHSDVGHVSQLMNKFEQNSPTNKTNQSFAVGKNVYPVSKISPFTTFTNGASQLHKIRLSEQKNNIIDVKDKMVNTTKSKHDDTACKGKQPKNPKAKSELKLEIKNKSTENKGISKESEMKGKLLEIRNKNDDKFCNEKQTKTAEVKLEIEAKTTEQPDKPTKPCVPRKYSNSPKSPVIPRDQERIMSSDDLNNCSWYVPDASRVVADKKLRLIGENGAFLIRKSQKGLTPYSMSVFQSGRIFNLQIRRREDNMYAIGSVKPDEKSFSSLIDLVSFHLSNPIEIQGAGEKLYLRHPSPTQCHDEDVSAIDVS